MESNWSFRLREWFSESVSETDSVPDQHLALAALLVEMMHADYRDKGSERDTVVRMLARSCGVDREEAEALLARGEQASNQSVSLFEHTRTLDVTLSEQEKFAVIEALWEVAYADDVLDGKEDYLAHRLADLLHVRHSDLMRIKNQVVERKQSE